MPVVSARVTAATPSVDIAGDGVQHLLLGDDALERTAERSRQRAGDRLAAAARDVEHLGEAVERFGDAAPHVGAVVRFRYRDHQHHFIDIGCERALGAARIRHQRDIRNRRVARDAGHHAFRVAQVRNRLGRHERRRLYLGQPGGGEPVDQLDLALGRHPLRLDLQAVAGDDVVDENPLVHGCTFQIVPAARSRSMSASA